MQFSKEFKEALSQLPSKEKDKLLLRLLKKDINLANRLHFELLDQKTVDDQRALMAARVKERAAWISEKYYSPGYLMMDLRYLSGEITEHVNITKDKFGEITLTLLMLNECLPQCMPKVATAPPSKSRKLLVYIIARAFKLLLLIKKMHEDYQIDFKDEVCRLGEHLSESPLLMKTAIYHGLDVNWLLQFQIPEAIEDIHRDLRQRGYLK
jgi:hypothetical protein